MPQEFVAGATPPPPPVQGAAKRVLELMNPPKGTPVVAQQLDSDKEANAGIPASTPAPGAVPVGKENADAGGFLTKALDGAKSLFGKSEPGAKT